MQDERQATHSRDQLRRQQAVVGVAMRGEQFLVIRRSSLVRAPGKICMPGGRLELGESQPDAVARELREELAVEVKPQRAIWSSVSPWGTELFWWSVDLAQTAQPVPNPREVDSFAWMTASELLQAPNLLQSAIDFLHAFQSRKFQWP
jgi:(d)CTP diphosphatase